MAIAFVAANTASGTATTLSLTRPSGTTTGDLLIATVELFDNSLIPSVAGTGWTVLDRVQNTATGNAHGSVTLWRLDDGSGSYSFTWGGSSQFRTGMILAYNGGPTGVEAHTFTAQTSNASTTLRGTSTTTLSANAMVVMVGTRPNAALATPPSGMAERVDADRQYAADVIQAVAGSTGNKDATQAAADASNGGLIVLTPPAALNGQRMKMIV